jgi:hypothetical protein
MTSKNQNAAQRAETARADFGRPTSRFCNSKTCPERGKPIKLGELKPVMFVPGHRMRYYHKACYDSGAL